MRLRLLALAAWVWFCLAFMTLEVGVFVNLVFAVLLLSTALVGTWRRSVELGDLATFAWDYVDFWRSCAARNKADADEWEAAATNWEEQAAGWQAIAMRLADARPATPLRRVQ